MSYPSEKSSFDVFLGADGNDMSDYSYFETPPPPPPPPTDTKPKFDAEKVAGAITAGATAVGSVGTAIDAFKGDGSKPKSRRKQLKDVCGRKPLLKKNRVEYDKCVSDYNAGKVGGFVDKRGETEYTDTKKEDETPAKSNTTRNVIIGLVVVGVIVTAFVGYKKGWFGKKK
jgi:hypothetical protein